MKILSNYQITSNYNYQTNLLNQNKHIAFKGNDLEQDIFELHGNNDDFAEPILNDEDMDKIMEACNIAKIDTIENIVALENNNGDFGEIKIPIEYFQTGDNKEEKIKFWLADSILNSYNEEIPFELMDIADKLGLYRNNDHKAQLEIYRNALAKDINIVHFEKDPTTQRAAVYLEVEGKPCKFSIYAQNREEACRSLEDNENEKSINTMIQNLRDTLHGEFIRNDNIEVFVPYILERTPDIKKDETLVLNGNPAKSKTSQLDETEGTEDIYAPFKERLEEFAGHDINSKEIKTIKYLSTPQKGFDNNKVKTAYGYYDKNSERLYLYFPSTHRMQVLLRSKFVQNFYDI